MMVYIKFVIKIYKKIDLNKLWMIKLSVEEPETVWVHLPQKKLTIQDL